MKQSNYPANATPLSPCNILSSSSPKRQACDDQQLSLTTPLVHTVSVRPSPTMPQNSYTESPDCHHQSKEHHITRRNFFRLSGAFAAGLILLKGASWAFSYEVREFTDGVHYVNDEPGAAWNGVAYTNRCIGWHSDTWWWQISRSQYFMLRAACNAWCLYTTELYQCMIVRTYMHWGDENNYRPYISLWIADGDDCRIRSYIDGELVHTRHIDLVNPDGYGPIHQTDSWQSVETVQHWFRREDKDVFHRFWSDVGVYEIYDWGDYIGTADWPARNIRIPASDRPGQTCPKISIVNDQSLRNTIVTIRPFDEQTRCAQAAHAAHCSEIELQTWEGEVSQLWLCIAGSSEASCDTNCLISMQNFELALSHYNGELPSINVDDHADSWAQAQVQAFAANAKQQHWCVNREGVYHLFCDCSGQALWHPQSNESNRALTFHTNGYCEEEWSNQNHWWTIEEVIFSGTVELSGDTCVGGALSLGNLHDCTPKESQTKSHNAVFYQVKLWSSPSQSQEHASLVFSGQYTSASQVLQAFYIVSSSDLGCYLRAQVNLVANCAQASWNTNHEEWQFKGDVFSDWFGPIQGAVSFYVDGEDTPCYIDEQPPQANYTPPSQASNAARKPNCSDLDAWYTDKAGRERYTASENRPPSQLYGFNQVSVSHRLCTQTQQIYDTYALYSTRQCTEEIHLEPSKYDTTIRYKSVYRFPAIPPSIAYYQRDGQTRTLLRDSSHIYFDSDCTDARPYQLAITQNTCAYYRWMPQRFDGVYAR